jgi:hypothetical protein
MAVSPALNIGRIQVALKFFKKNKTIHRPFDDVTLAGTAGM